MNSTTLTRSINAGLSAALPAGATDLADQVQFIRKLGA